LILGFPNWPVIYFINYMPTSSLALFITAPSLAATLPELLRAAAVAAGGVGGPLVVKGDREEGGRT
jgi:hypothetical protein